MRLFHACVIALALSASQFAFADDWPQWRGPERDAIWRETGIIEKFPAEGPKIRWRVPVAGGYSGPAVANGKVFVTDYVRSSGQAVNNPGTRAELQGRERVLCFDEATGKELWKHEYDCPYKISYPAGPRCTPTVDGDRVYTLGSEGDLICLSTDGEVVWSRQLKKDYKVEAPIWGFSAHPLVDGDRLVCIVGGQGSVAVAFDKHTGKEVWKSLSAAEPGYAPPSIIEAGGKRQLVIWHPESINALDPETGEKYWSVPLKPEYGMAIMSPLKHGDLLFASGIGGAAAALKLDDERPGAKVEWRGEAKTAVYCANSTPIIDEAIIYGCDCMSGGLRAVDLKTGKRLWESFAPTTGDRRGGHGTAFLVKNEDRYLLFSETGDLIFARLTKAGYEEVSRAHIVEPTGECFGRNVVWTHPAYANKSAYIRNDKELVCVSLAAN